MTEQASRQVLAPWPTPCASIGAGRGPKRSFMKACPAANCRDAIGSRARRCRSGSENWGPMTVWLAVCIVRFSAMYPTAVGAGPCRQVRGGRIGDKAGSRDVASGVSISGVVAPVVSDVLRGRFWATQWRTEGVDMRHHLSCLDRPNWRFLCSRKGWSSLE